MRLDTFKDFAMVTKGLFLIAILTTIILNASLQKICSEISSPHNPNGCVDLCGRLPGELKCKESGQVVVCECFHEINSRYPSCPESTTDQCGKACGEEPFECRIAKGKPACYCTGLKNPIYPYCPTDQYVKCRVMCNLQSSEGECINVRNETNACFCKWTLDTDGSNRRIMRFH